MVVTRIKVKQINAGLRPHGPKAPKAPVFTSFNDFVAAHNLTITNNQIAPDIWSCGFQDCVFSNGFLEGGSFATGISQEDALNSFKIKSAGSVFVFNNVELRCPLAWRD